MEHLKKNNVTLTTAESCTGGMISACITDISGSSAIFDRSFITYSNEAKIELIGVNYETLKQYGAVSEKTAIEMAEGALKNSNATLSIAITGVAGPGASAGKPQGLVYIAISFNGTTRVVKNKFQHDRNAVRTATTKKALQMIIDIFK